MTPLPLCASGPAPTELFAAGALRMQRGHVSITNSYLTDNRAHRHGGAVFVGTVGIAGEPAAILEDIRGCYNGSVRPALLLSSCNVSGNTAEASGGEFVCVWLQWQQRCAAACRAAAAAVHQWRSLARTRSACACSTGACTWDKHL